MENNIEEVNINGEYIKLQQFLKLKGIISQGCEAKFFILENNIRINGEICKERGKKLKNNDVIEIENYKKYKITLKN